MVKPGRDLVEMRPIIVHREDFSHIYAKPCPLDATKAILKVMLVEVQQHQVLLVLALDHQAYFLTHLAPVLLLACPRH